MWRYALEKFREALEMYQNGGQSNLDYYQMAQNLWSVADIYYEQEKFKDSLQKYEEALSMFEKICVSSSDKAYKFIAKRIEMTIYNEKSTAFFV